VVGTVVEGVVEKCDEAEDIWVVVGGVLQRYGILLKEGL
jgi:hypothetical protein